MTKKGSLNKKYTVRQSKSMERKQGNVKGNACKNGKAAQWSRLLTKSGENI
jgi:hypothetical protein